MILVGLVVFSFVFAGLLSKLDWESSQSKLTVGKITGEAVYAPELNLARRYAYLQTCLTMRNRPEPSEELDKYLEKIAWQRIAALRAAEQVGLVTGDDEVRVAIEREFTDQNENYNAALYDHFVNYTLRGLNISETEFQKYFREHMTLMKLRGIISSASWVTPAEATANVLRFTDSFDVSYAMIPADEYPEEIKVTDADIQAFYDEHSEMFRQPTRTRVQYVSFPITNYAAATAVTDAQVRDYFEMNINDYTEYDTNGVEIVKPFEEVQDGIRSMLVSEAAADVAEKDAMDFVMMLTPDRHGNALPFADAARESGLPVATSAFFGRYEEVVGMEAPDDFKREAFELSRHDPEKYFSNPIVVEDAVLVMAYDETVEEHVPELAAVSNKVHELAYEDLKQQAVRTRANEVRDAIKAAIAAGDTFDEAARKQKLEAVATGPFTWFAPPTNMPTVELFLESIVSREQGEITDPLSTSNGVVLAYVASRSAGDASMNESFRSMLADSMRQQREAVIFALWQEKLLETEGTELRPAVDEDAEEGDGDPEAIDTAIDF